MWWLCAWLIVGLWVQPAVARAQRCDVAARACCCALDLAELQPAHGPATGADHLDRAPCCAGTDPQWRLSASTLPTSSAGEVLGPSAADSPPPRLDPPPARSSPRAPVAHAPRGPPRPAWLVLGVILR